MITEKIEFMRAGSFFSETHSADAADFTNEDGSIRWPDRKEIPWCYGYRLFKLSETEVTDDFGQTKTHYSRGDVGPWTYRGNAWTLDQVKDALARGDQRVTGTLVSNMEGNGWTRVLECRQGFVNISDDAQVVPDDEIPAAA